MAKNSKIGIGAWELDGRSTALDRLKTLNPSWYYNWKAAPLNGTGGPEFVPMVWGRSGPFTGFPSNTVLGFNEPDSKGQSNISVTDAKTLWKKLTIQPKLRLGSPAPTQYGTFGTNSWLNKFLSGAHVCFVACHFYSPDLSVFGMKNFLTSVHNAYGLPIWVTEWAGVDPATWNDNQPRFTMQQQAAFFSEAAAMMETLPWVERHAWFAAFTGGDDWNLNCHAIEDNGQLTDVGRAILASTS